MHGAGEGEGESRVGGSERLTDVHGVFELQRERESFMVRRLINKFSMATSPARRRCPDACAVRRTRRDAAGERAPAVLSGDGPGTARFADEGGRPAAAGSIPNHVRIRPLGTYKGCLTTLLNTVLRLYNVHCNNRPSPSNIYRRLHLEGCARARMCGAFVSAPRVAVYEIVAQIERELRHISGLSNRQVTAPKP